MCIAACIKKKPIKVQRSPSTWLAHLTLHGAADMAGACFWSVLFANGHTKNRSGPGAINKAPADGCEVDANPQSPSRLGS